MRCWILAAAFGALMSALAQPMASVPPALVEGRRALAAKDFARAKAVFGGYLRQHAGDVQAELGMADAELGLREFESAEGHYRHVVQVQPLLWAAHKNLVIVEAALGRWEDFDGERAVLKAARDRGAAGISAGDIDVIDAIDVRGQHWIVRYYHEPLGRTRTRYNFERFSAEGRVLEYVSLEAAEALKDELKGGAVVVGNSPMTPPPASDLALDWYNGQAHGVIHRYAVEPPYKSLRADFQRWVRTHKNRSTEIPKAKPKS